MTVVVQVQFLNCRK